MAKVLVLDDDPSVVSYLKRVLAALGHEIVAASNGSEGIDRISDRSISMIVSDLNMPGEPNRLELIRRLRELRPDCPLVVISGYASQDSLVEDCRALGVTEFLTKPFEIGFIKDILQRTLGSGSGQGSAGSVAK